MVTTTASDPPTPPAEGQSLAPKEQPGFFGQIVNSIFEVSSNTQARCPRGLTFYQPGANAAAVLGEAHSLTARRWLEADLSQL